MESADLRPDVKKAQLDNERNRQCPDFRQILALFGLMALGGMELWNDSVQLLARLERQTA